VTHSDGIYAIGTGCQYATGALHALKTVQMFSKPEVAEMLAQKALKITTTFDPHTGPPYMTYTQTS
jgi:ATP-dependent protease HslVU (ClpYQ) peptidase subunit